VSKRNTIKRGERVGGWKDTPAFPGDTKEMELCGLEVFETIERGGNMVTRPGGDPRVVKKAVLIVTDGPGSYFVVGMTGPEGQSFAHAVKDGNIGLGAKVAVTPYSGEPYVVFEAALKRARDVVQNWHDPHEGSWLYSGDATFFRGVAKYRPPPPPPSKPYEDSDEEFQRKRRESKPIT
jgi:hypothetical protein